MSVENVSRRPEVGDDSVSQSVTHRIYCRPSGLQSSGNMIHELNTRPRIDYYRISIGAIQITNVVRSEIMKLAPTLVTYSMFRVLFPRLYSPILIRGLVVTILLPIGYKLLLRTFRKCSGYLDTKLCSFEDSELMKPCFVRIIPTSLVCSILLESIETI